MPVTEEPFLCSMHVQVVRRLPAEVLNHRDRVPGTNGPICAHTEGGEQGFARSLAIVCNGSQDIPNPVLEEASCANPGLNLDPFGQVLVGDGGVIGLGDSLQDRSRLDHPCSQGVRR
jgi:hypothetical protein